MNYYIDTGTGPRGPYSERVIRDLLDTGEMDGGAACCREGSERWGVVDDWRAEILINTNEPAAPVRYGPVPVWRMVYGVCFLVLSFQLVGWAVLSALAVAAVPGGFSLLPFLAVLLLAAAGSLALGKHLTRRPGE